MAEQTYLFIGGPRDGMRISISIEQYVMYFPVESYVDDMSFPSPTCNEMASAYSTVSYRKRSIPGFNKSFDVFVVDGIGLDEVIAKLIGSYESNKQWTDRVKTEAANEN